MSIDRYQGSFPLLRIARDTGIPYPVVLSLGDWFDAEPFPVMEGSRFSEMFEILELFSDETVETAMDRISLARKHFMDQKWGRRDMYGCPIPRSEQAGRDDPPPANIEYLDAYRARQA